MKILKVSGDDYATLKFSKKHNGKLVIDIVDDIEKYESDDGDDGFWELEVLEFKGDVKDIDQNLLKWIKSEIDYDNYKHQFYYFDNETIKF